MVRGIAAGSGLSRLAAIAVALLLLALVPQLIAGVAHADQAGKTYKKSLAKAKKQKKNRITACKKRKGKAKKACIKSANATFKKAKAKAQDKRNKTREEAAGGEAQPEGKPTSPTDEYHACLKEHRDRDECRELR